MQHVTAPLAQADTASILLWSLALIFLLVLLFGAIVGFKKWLSDDDEKAEKNLGFTLGDLRRLHEQGQLSDEEYDRARNQMIAATQRAAERDAQRAAEAAKERGSSVIPTTDVDAIRRRAQAHRQRQQQPPNPTPPADNPPPTDSPPLNPEP